MLQLEILRLEDKIVLTTFFCLIPYRIEIRYIACNLIDHITLINDRSYWMCKRSAGFLTMTLRLKQHPLYQHDEQLTSYMNYEKRLLLVDLLITTIWSNANINKVKIGYRFLAIVWRNSLGILVEHVQL